MLMRSGRKEQADDETESARNGVGQDGVQPTAGIAFMSNASFFINQGAAGSPGNG